jgi:hypothetical protein
MSVSLYDSFVCYSANPYSSITDVSGFSCRVLMSVYIQPQRSSEQLPSTMELTSMHSRVMLYTD